MIDSTFPFIQIIILNMAQLSYVYLSLMSFFSFKGLEINKKQNLERLKEANRVLVYSSISQYIYNSYDMNKLALAHCCY